MSQHVTVVEYDDSWKRMFEAERELIGSIMGRACIASYHIGSTSVPGLSAKPVIDILVAARSLEEADGCREAFESAGYEWMGEFGIPGRRYLRKGGDERTHQIHIFRCDDWKQIDRHLAVRDYLRTHDDECRRYSSLKKELAKRFPYDIDGYCDGKDSFVREIERKALFAYDSTWDRLYASARLIQGHRQISPMIEAGSVAAALIAESGRIFTGVCIDTACSLGMCAERSAIAQMISAGESRIRKLVVVMEDGSLTLPCGACQEMMMQLDGEGSAELLTDLDERSSIAIESLVGKWWGRS